MKKLSLVFVLIIFLTPLTIYSQSLEDITSSGLKFFLNSNKSRNLSNDQRTGLSILESLMRKQGNRNHELDVANAGKTQVNLGGTVQEIKILPGSDGGFYLVTKDKVYRIDGALLNQVRGNSNFNLGNINYPKRSMVSEEEKELANKYYSKSVEFFNEGNYELSMMNSQKALSINPTLLNAKRVLGAAKIRLGDYDSGITLLEACLEEEPNDQFTQSNMGLGYMNKGEYETSIKFFSNSLVLDESWQAYYNRGTCYLNLKKYNLAIIDFTESITLNSSSWQAYYNRGTCYLNLKKYNLAIIDFTESIELNSSRWEFYLGRAFCYESLQKYNLAITDYQKTISLGYPEKEKMIEEINRLKGLLK